jgi:hypothetical protein
LEAIKKTVQLYLFTFSSASGSDNNWCLKARIANFSASTNI